MSQSAAPPILTVRYDGSERTFAPGNDVVIGRDLRADVRVAHPLISRVHLVLRFDQGRWVAIDNGSLNGLYLNNRRVPALDIQDGQRVTIATQAGPAVICDVGRHRGSAGTPPLTASMPIVNPLTGPPDPRPAQGRPPTSPGWPGQPQQPPASPSRPMPTYPTGSQPSHQTGSQPHHPTGTQPAG